jgi:REP element-mobilizing transposase RayT
MITRRVVQRRFLLRPDAAINAIFDYCLAESATRYKIDLIAWLAMSNHYHAVVHDPEGRLPAFLEHFHKLVAKTLNSYHERWENFWSTEETCVTRLVTPEDVLDKVVYVLTNPVSAHLVDSVSHWPGASSWSHMGRTATTENRPRQYFRKERSVMPTKATLRAVAPPGLDDVRYAAWIKDVRKAVEAREVQAKRKRDAEHIKLVGRKAVLATAPFDGPKTDTPRQKLRPALACKDRKRMTKERAMLRAFRLGYAIARLEYIKGKHTVVFPAGTYRLRLWGVCCAPYPGAA